MIQMRIEKKNKFSVLGKKIWIPGNNNQILGMFWDECLRDNTVSHLQELSKGKEFPNKAVFGVSRVEYDPSDSAFYFYIVCESNEKNDMYESFEVKEQLWAVFRTDQPAPNGLVQCRLECFYNWLPTSKYIRDNNVEIQMYPTINGKKYCELYIPIKEKEIKSA